MDMSHVKLKLVHKQWSYTVRIVHGCRSPLLEKGFCSIFLKIPGGFHITHWGLVKLLQDVHVQNCYSIQLGITGNPFWCDNKEVLLVGFCLAGLLYILFSCPYVACVGLDHHSLKMNWSMHACYIHGPCHWYFTFTHYKTGFSLNDFCSKKLVAGYPPRKCLTHLDFKTLTGLLTQVTGKRKNFGMELF